MSDKKYIGDYEFKAAYRAFKSIYDVANAMEYSIDEIDEPHEYCGAGGVWLIKGLCMKGLTNLICTLKCHIDSLPNDFDKTELTDFYEVLCSATEDINGE